MSKKPKISSLGVFKLKDRHDRNAVMIDFAKMPMDKADKMFISKVFGENNKIEIKIVWKENENTKQVFFKEGILQSGS